MKLFGETVRSLLCTFVIFLSSKTWRNLFPRLIRKFTFHGNFVCLHTFPLCLGHEGWSRVSSQYLQRILHLCQHTLFFDTWRALLACLDVDIFLHRCFVPCNFFRRETKDAFSILIQGFDINIKWRRRVALSYAVFLSSNIVVLLWINSSTENNFAWALLRNYEFDVVTLRI